MFAKRCGPTVTAIVNTVCALAAFVALVAPFGAIGCVSMSQNHVQRANEKQGRKAEEGPCDHLRMLAVTAFEEFLMERSSQYEDRRPDSEYHRDEAYHVYFLQDREGGHTRFIFSDVQNVGDGSYHVVLNNATGEVVEIGVGR